jgi:hypothetical protein
MSLRVLGIVFSNTVSSIVFPRFRLSPNPIPFFFHFFNCLIWTFLEFVTFISSFIFVEFQPSQISFPLSFISSIVPHLYPSSIFSKNKFQNSQISFIEFHKFLPSWIIELYRHSSIFSKNKFHNSQISFVEFHKFLPSWISESARKRRCHHHVDLIVISSEQRESSEPTKLFSFSQLA